MRTNIDMRICATAILCTFLMAGCRNGGTVGGEPPGQPPGPAPAGSSILLSDSQRSLEAGLTSTSFNFYDLPALWVRVLTPQMPRSAMLRLAFMNPKGVVVYSDESMFTTDPAGGIVMHPVMGSPMSLNVIKPTIRGSALDRSVPVTGTSFTRFPEEGDWQVQATIDGVPGMITSPMQVTISR